MQQGQQGHNPPRSASEAEVNDTQLCCFRVVLSVRGRMEVEDVHILVVADKQRNSWANQASLGSVALLASEFQRAFRFHEANSDSLTDIALGDDYDVLLLDITGRDKSSLNVIRELRTKLSDIPIIVLTDSKDSGIALEALQNGATDYLLKQHADVHSIMRAVYYAAESHRLNFQRCGENCIIHQLASGQPLKIVLHQLILTIESQLKNTIGSILLLDKTGELLFTGAAPHLPDWYNTAVSGTKIGPGVGSCGTAAYFQKRVIVDNIQTDPLWKDYREAAKKANVQACWSHPIFSAHGKIIGTFALYYSSPRRPSDFELQLIERYAALAGVIIDRHRADEELLHRIELEHLITSISKEFINIPIPRLDDQIQKTLWQIGTFESVDRSYIFLVDADGASITNTHEWCAREVPAQAHRLQHLPIDAFPWWFETLQRDNLVHIPYVKNLPPEAEVEKVEFETQGIRSLIAVPLIYGGTQVGFLGFDCVHEEKSWSDDTINLLRLISDILVNALARRWNMEALTQSRELLQRGESQFRLALETSSIGIATCTLQGDIFWANKSFGKLLGRSTKSLCKKLLQDLVGKDSRADLLEFLSKFREQNISQSRSERMYIHADGTAISVEENIRLVFDHQNQPGHLLLEIIDLTEKKKWEQESVRLSNLESIGLVATGIAHDFNNMMTAVSGGLGVALLDSNMSHSIRHRLNEVEQAVQRAQQLAYQLLRSAKGGPLETQLISPSQLIRESASLILRGQKCRCEFKIPEEIWGLNGNASQLTQVMTNLIINAIQAMPDGGTIRIQCENVPDGLRSQDEHATHIDAVRISVEDEGCGISTEHIKRIFNPFYTTKENGSGLGLATSQSIVRKHGGKIMVDSVPGQGSVFTVTLPASSQRLDSTESSSHSPLIQQFIGRVLVMDDDEMVREVAGSMLTHLGYDMALAIDGNEAIQKYSSALREQRRYDAVILDLSVPGGLGGKAAVQSLRRMDPLVKAIVSSGYSNDPIMSDFRNYGFCAVVAKPYEIGTLCRILNEVLGEPVAQGSSVQ